MQPINRLWHLFHYPWAICMLAVILAGNRAVVAAERPGPEAVEDLKVALRNVALGKEERAARKAELETRINALHSVSDMRQALALSEWRDGELPVKKGKIKRVAADTGEFVVTDQNGKDWTFGTFLASANLNKMRASTSWKPEDLKVGTEVIVNYKQGADRLEATDVGEEVVEDIDRPIRAELAGRLTQVLRDQLQGDTGARLAALTVIGEMGIKVRGVGTNTGYARSFTADIADLLKSSKEAPVLRTGARVLGMIDPEPKAAVAALEGLLGRDPALRQAGAEGLLGMVRTLRQLIKNDNDPTAQAKITKSAVLEQPIEIVEAAATLVPAAVRGLVNDDFEVRRRCLEVIEVVAVELEATILKQLKPLEERRELMPLIEALNKAAPAVGKAASDRTGVSSARRAQAAAARLQAARTLEAIGITRQRLRGELPKLPRVPTAEATTNPLAVQAVRLTAAAPLAPVDAKTPDLLATGMQGALPELESAVSDPDTEVRLAALEAIETYGPQAVGALTGLVKALGDSNRYVRWAAVRILGKIDPAKAEEAVPGLARLLNDPALKQQIEPDQDVRMNAAMTLERLGSVAAAAAPALTRSISEGDAEEREKVIYARAAVGQATKEAVLALAGQLTEEDPRVRRAAAEALGRFAPIATIGRDTKAALVRALDDEDAEVRRAAADALANILPSPKGR